METIILITSWWVTISINFQATLDGDDFDEAGDDFDEAHDDFDNFDDTDD